MTWRLDVYGGGYRAESADAVDSDYPYLTTQADMNETCRMARPGDGHTIFNGHKRVAAWVCCENGAQPTRGGPTKPGGPWKPPACR